MVIDLYVVISTIIDYNEINNVHYYIEALSVMKNDEGKFKDRFVSLKEIILFMGSYS